MAADARCTKGARTRAPIRLPAARLRTPAERYADPQDAAIFAEHALEVHEVELLRRACEAADRADAARELVASEGLTVTDRYDQTKPHPAVSIERHSRLAQARVLRELNLPSAAGEPGSR